MMNRFKFVLFLLFIGLFPQFSNSQELDTKWWNPVESQFPVIEGQAWPKEVGKPYDRFPARAQKTVNVNVWNISHSSAGLLIRFKTNAKKITVGYAVEGSHAMSHMPATGVSGVDLYALNLNGQWKWAPGSFSFGDTISYQYSNLNEGDYYTSKGCEFRLYLPLYNSVKWLQIGVPRDAEFKALPARDQKPIVVYGTSIAQGACASRPGMAWTAILGRKMDRPLINISFSGSGKLENGVTDLLTEIDAKVFILDCLHNLTAQSGISKEEVNERIIETVHRIRRSKPFVPILLAAHSGVAENYLDTARLHEYGNINLLLEKAFEQLKAEGVKDIYVLSNKDIGLDMSSTVDGLHPNDIGMQQYADAYERHLRVILKEPVGDYSTTHPCIQYRDGYYNWEDRHNEILKLNKQDPPNIVFFGNSITHYWGGEPVAPIERGASSWTETFKPFGVRNSGFGWDQIENVLWRAYHEELDGYKAKQILILIGTNNLTLNSDKEIIAGLELLVTAIRERQPNAPIFLLGLFPRRDMEKRIENLNKAIAQLIRLPNVKYRNPGQSLLGKTGKIDEQLFEDGLHPNEKGYAKIAGLLKPILIAPTANKSND